MLLQVKWSTVLLYVSFPFPSLPCSEFLPIMIISIVAAALSDTGYCLAAILRWVNVQPRRRMCILLVTHPFSS
jgi:hypothetical protein